jgi:dTDP-4-amino-4,6-dideoxygalactose transaminase
MQIPFNRPYLTGKELGYMKDVLDSLGRGGHISGDGAYTKKVQGIIESRFHARRCLLTTSCTSALELATRLLNVKAGDEVIVPSYTFSSTVNPVLMAGARPVFAEIEENTLNIDPRDIERKITPRTRAIYPMHYAGVACAMDEIMEMAGEHDLRVVEDAAQAVNAKYRGRYLGTIGDFGCYSFHETKNYVCGEGGALLINTGDPEDEERAEVIREKGTNRNKFIRGEVDKYTWVDVGSSYLPSDILAAFLCAQLEKLDEIQEKRMHIWQAYHNGLKPLEEGGLLRLPDIPGYAEHNAHLFYTIHPDRAGRDRVLSALQEKGIRALFHYIPLDTSPVGKRIGKKRAALPKTNSLSHRLLRLPLFPGLTGEEVRYILQTFITIMQEGIP